MNPTQFNRGFDPDGVTCMIAGVGLFFIIIGAICLIL
jgi:hypothetical protein